MLVTPQIIGRMGGIRRKLREFADQNCKYLDYNLSNSPIVLYPETRWVSDHPPKGKMFVYHKRQKPAVRFPKSYLQLFSFF